MQLRDSKLLYIDKFGTEEGCQLADALFFVLNGSFTLKINGKTELISKNDLVSFPKDMYFERHIISPLSFYYIKLTENNNLPYGKVPVDNSIRMISTFHFMHSAYHNNSRKLANHFLEDIFAQIKAERECSVTSYDQITNDAICYLNERIKDKVYLTDLTTALNISATSLIDHFKRNVGHTPLRYLTLMRIDLAEKLLVTSELTLSEIASECGYDTPFYLSNAFKKEKGISPRLYRQLYRI